MQAKLPITVLVQTKNEEVGIGFCLDALDEFDEVVVVDSNSTDKTKELAAKHGARVENFTWNGQYPKKKQWQLDNLKLRNEWVLFMDADETPTGYLIEELRSQFSQDLSTVSAFDINLDYVFAGKTLKYGHRVTKRCLVKVGEVEFPIVDDLDLPGMGELEGHYQPTAQQKVMRLHGRILHDDKDPISTWFTRHNKYSDWEAALRSRAEAQANVRSLRTIKGRVFDSMPFKPVLFFAYSYLLRLGFLDGRAGFDYAYALATYYWQINLKIRALKGSSTRLGR